MNYKIRCIIKRPDEQYGHVTNISNRLENLQRTVEGYIEVVPVKQSPDGKDIILICNEEGKLRGLPHNFYLWDEEIVGTVIICGVDGDEFGDLPLTFGLAEWKKFLNDIRWKQEVRKC